MLRLQSHSRLLFSSSLSPLAMWAFFNSSFSFSWLVGRPPSSRCCMRGLYFEQEEGRSADAGHRKGGRGGQRRKRGRRLWQEKEKGAKGRGKGESGTDQEEEERFTLPLSNFSSSSFSSFFPSPFPFSVEEKKPSTPFSLFSRTREEKRWEGESERAGE